MVSESIKLSTQKRIVEAASRIFFAQGFYNVSVDRLVGELGMSKKTLYTFYPSKEAILDAVLHRKMERADAALAEASKAPNFPERVRQSLHRIHEQMGEVSPVFLEDIRCHAPGSFRIIEEFRARAIPRVFGEMLEEGKREGLVQGDPTLLVLILTHCIQTLVRPEVLNKLGLTPRQALDSVLGVVFQGMLTEQGRVACADFLNS